MRKYLRAIAALCVLGWAGAAPAQVRDFDHLRSGYSLTGMHLQQRCESCHINNQFKGTPRTCEGCHVAGSQQASGNVVRPAQHFPTPFSCSNCHSTTTFSGAVFNHAGVAAGSCQSCHNGRMASGQPANHIRTQAACDVCHRTSGWASITRLDHRSFNAATACGTCHNGRSATGKPANHIPVGSTNCFACHNTSPAAWRPVKWNHTQLPVAGQCATCHTGAYPPADGKPANHIPYQVVPATAGANCDTCHKAGYAIWPGAKFHATASVTNGCSNCHTGSYLNATGKPKTATHASATLCENCHLSASNWLLTRADHGSFNSTTNCASCHNGVTATGRPPTHIPVGTNNCTACHNIFQGAWLPNKWNHTQVVVTGRCATCHTGAYPPALGRKANHIPYLAVPALAAANCDTCHKNGYTAFAPARLHASVTVGANCGTCHSGAYPPVTAKPNTQIHVNATVCETCHHSTANWGAVQFVHAAANAVGTGTCDTCHNGSTALGRPATHIPVAGGQARCDSCHKSQISFASAMTMNHAVVSTTQCKICHNGSYASQGPVGAQGKPPNHIPEALLLNGAAMDCNACHTSTVNRSAITMNHNNSQGSPAGTCKGCHLAGTNYLGNIDRNPLTHKQTNPVPTDCSQAGCHRPLGNTGTPYRSWF